MCLDVTNIKIHSWASYQSGIFRLGVRVMVFYATFNNISVISCRAVLLVEETRVSEENLRPVTSQKD
jgi:SpoU rRNA methylase family enzyme